MFFLFVFSHIVTLARTSDKTFFLCFEVNASEWKHILVLKPCAKNANVWYPMKWVFNIAFWKETYCMNHCVNSCRSGHPEVHIWSNEAGDTKPYFGGIVVVRSPSSTAKSAYNWKFNQIHFTNYILNRKMFSDLWRYYSFLFWLAGSDDGNIGHLKPCGYVQLFTVGR